MGAFWQQRWNEKQALLSMYPQVPDDFRANERLILGLESRSLNSENQALWEKRCEEAGVPLSLQEDTLIGNPPEKFKSHGKWVTVTSLRHAHSAHTISKVMENAPRPLRILEIGAGFGGLAATLARVMEIEHYTFVDAEPCLALQHSFTSRAMHYVQKFFLKPEDEWLHDYDLFVNMNSFAEMASTEVNDYFRRIQRLARTDTVLYTVNRLERTARFREYPYDKFWRHEILHHYCDHVQWVECLSVRDHRADSKHPLLLIENQK